MCEDVSLAELAEEFGTPLYVYSRARILHNLSSLRNALSGVTHQLCYALKANANPVILSMLAAEGVGADVVSVGELLLARNAGIPADKITFAGVGKREDEIEAGLTHGVHSFNVESMQELQLISRIAFRTKQTARVLLRINPDIDAQSHPYISTGLHEHKFGIESEKAIESFKQAKTLPNIQVLGVHLHIGSQITASGPFVQALDRISQLITKLREGGIEISHLDIGGGFGVKYLNVVEHESLPREEENTPFESAAHILESLGPVLQSTGCTIWLEPGRSIVADAGALLTRVLYTKENGGKKFIIVDAGMNDLIRPSLYSAYHQIVPLTIDTYENEPADVVGPVCETGDFFARSRLLPKAKPNDGLSIMTAGAYGFVLSSNYNGRPRPAEILVAGDKVRVIRKRQTLDELL